MPNSAYESPPPQWVALKPGDEVHFLAGDYTDAYVYSDEEIRYQGLFLRDVHGTAAEPIRLIGHPGARLAARAPGRTEMDVMHLWQSSHIEVRGFEIAEGYGNGLSVSECVGIRVHDNWIHDIDGINENNLAGIHVITSSDIDIYDNLLHDNYGRARDGQPPTNPENGRHMVFMDNTGPIHVHHNSLFGSGATDPSVIGVGMTVKHAGAGSFEADHNIIVGAWDNSIGTGSSDSYIHHNLILDSDAFRVTDFGGDTTLDDIVIAHNTLVSDDSGATRGGGLNYNPTDEYAPIGTLTFAGNLIYDRRNYDSEQAVINVHTYGPDRLYDLTVTAGNLAIEGQLPTGQPKAAFSATADRGPNLAGLPAQEDPWPGLAARPAQIPGLGRWQIETAAVRSQARAFQFTPDGKRLVVADGCRIRVYEVPSFRLQHVLLGHPGPIMCLAINPAGNLVAAGTAYWSPEVRMWDLTTGIQKATTQKTTQFDHNIFGLAWSPDGAQLAVCAKIWNQTPRGSLHLLDAQLARREVLDTDLDLQRMCWSPDGKWIAAVKPVGEKSEVHLWAPDGKAGPVLPVNGTVECIAFTPDGKSLAAGGDLRQTESALLTWDTVKWTPKTIALGTPACPWVFAWEARGQRLALLADHAVWLCDVASGKTTWLERHGFAGSIAFSSTGDWIAHGGAGADVCTWNVKTGSRGPSLGYERSSQYAEFHACVNGQVVAMSSEDERGAIRLWNPDGRPGPILRGHTSTVTAMGFSADGERLASASHEPIIRLWSKAGQTGAWRAAQVAALAGHADEVQSVAWNRDGTRLVSGSRDGKVGVWDVATGKLQFPFLSQAGPIEKVAWSATGKHFASLCPADKEHPIRVWSAEGQPVLAPDARPGTNAMSWSPEGEILAIGGDEPAVRLWSIAERKAIVELAGTSLGWHLAWSPDGQWVATDHGGIRLWRRDGTPDLFAEGGHGRPLFSPDSTQLAAGELVIGVTDKTTRRFGAGSANLGFDPLVWSSDSRHLLAIDLATLTCWDTETMTVASNSVILPAGQGARITADGTLETTGPQAEQEIIYIVEGPGGQQKVYSPAEFRKLVADLPTNSSPGSNAAATGSP